MLSDIRPKATAEPFSRWTPSVMVALARTAEERHVHQAARGVGKGRAAGTRGSAAKRVSFVIPEPVRSSLRGLGSSRVTGNRTA